MSIPQVRVLRCTYTGKVLLRNQIGALRKDIRTKREYEVKVLLPELKLIGITALRTPPFLEG
jgi:hypothetical protein